MKTLTLFVGMLSLLLTYVAAAQEPPPARESPQTRSSQKPLYWQDTRLAQEIRLKEDRTVRPPVLHYEPTQTDRDYSELSRFPGPVRVVNARLLPSRLIAEAIREQTQAPVFIQGDWGRELVVAPLAAGTARELMDHLARAFSPGRWWKLGQTWVLARTAAEGSLTIMSTNERVNRERATVMELLRAISPREWQILVERDKLEPSQMSPAVRNLFMRHVQLYIYDPERNTNETYRPEALRGEGLKLWLQWSGKNTLLALVGPGFMPTIPFYDEDGKLQWGIPPPR